MIIITYVKFYRIRRKITIEYSIARKEHLPMILELYKQLIPEEIPVDTKTANRIWKKIENNYIK